MSKKLVGWVALGVGAAVAAPAWAQEASFGASADTSKGATADASATPPEPPAEPAASADANASAAPAADEGAKFEPYEPGYPPENNVLEIGVFGGAFFPSKNHNIRDQHYDQVKYKVGAEFGGRLGYYPLAFLGIEGDVMGALSRVRTNNETTKAVLYSGRGSLVLQLPVGYVTPFVLGGAGKLAGIGTAMGKDSDVAWHFGIGAKVPITHILSLRVDGRDNLTAHTSGDGQAHSFEATIGLTAVIERSRKEPPPPPADTDHDGVLDRDDKCPTEAGTNGGCPADSDNDGVLDRDDYCPKEAGIAPKGCPDPDPDKDGVPLPCDLCPDEVGVKPDGCAIKDTDKDGIFDDKDKCPKEPETKNGFEDSDGCPDKIPDSFKKFTGVVQGIVFDQGKATIRKQSNATLEGAVKILQEYPSVKMEISGHTSSEGNKENNAKLSQDRADAVKTWLVEKGVDPNRITTRGAGSDEPIGDNKTAVGRNKNRRIEFKILQ